MHINIAIGKMPICFDAGNEFDSLYLTKNIVPISARVGGGEYVEAAVLEPV